MSVARLLAAVTLACCAWPAFAQSSVRDHANIDQGAVQGTSGRIALNQAAGQGNAQANLAAFAITDQGSARLALGSRQQSGAMRGEARSARADIGRDALSSTSGALALNQAAGSANQQTNLLAIGHGTTSLHALQVLLADDATLAQTGSAATGPEGTAIAQPGRHASIDSEALRGNQGVMQVNQSVGVGNLSTNAIVLQLPGTP